MACKGKNWLPADYGRTTVNHKQNSEPKKEKPSNRESKTVNQKGVNIDDLLKTVNEIRNKTEIIQVKIPLTNAG